MDAKDLALLVRRMRQAQKRYFTTRDGVDLRESKRLEQEVDAAVAEVVGCARRERGLFDGEGQADG